MTAAATITVITVKIRERGASKPLHIESPNDWTPERRVGCRYNINDRIRLCPDTIRTEGDYMANLSQIAGQLKTEEERLTRELRMVSSALAAFGARSGIQTRRRKLSAAGRARIVAAQRARWAKVRGGKQNVVAMPKRRTMSAAARKKIAAAQRARWARVKAQSKVA
jgi:hypothetical protein